MTYQRHGGDRRGSAPARRASRLWLLSPWGGHDWGTGWLPFGGDGFMVPCFWCQKPLDFYSVERDRIVPGGSYRRDNLVPACSECNKDRGTRTISQYAQFLGITPTRL